MNSPPRRLVAAVAFLLVPMPSALAAAPDSPPAESVPPKGWLDVLDLRVSGYVQPQYTLSQLSEDEVTVEGEPQNQDRFLVRRGRLQVSRVFRYARGVLEVDVNTVDGPQVGVSEAAVSGFLPRAAAGAAPYVTVTAGLFDIPFGGELPQGSRNRVFMERTLGSRALFPGENDVGAAVNGALGPLRATVSVVNGVPLSTTGSGDGSVFTAEKTLVARIGAQAGDPALDAPAPDARWALRGGVSWLSGTALHEGTAETKSSLLWSDSNQNGLVTLDELVGVNAQSATPSEAFHQWGVGGDLALGFRTPLGWTRLYGEATLASNLDRGYYPADPVSVGYDVRELAWTAGAVQEVYTYGLVGVRADSYDPDADAFESRRGTYTPTDLSVLTLSPILGAQLPGLGRLVVQYDYIVDHLGRDDLGEPRDLANDQLTVRAQMEF